MLGISASTLFLAALIPGIAILVSILITNIIVNRIYAYEGGGNMSFAEWLGNLGKSLKSGWYAFIVPGHHLLRHLLGPADADRGRCDGRRRHHHHGLHPWHAEACRLPGDADQLGQGERRHPADHRLLCSAWPRRLRSWVCRRVSSHRSPSLTDEPYILILMMIGILIAAGCVMETTPNIVILAPILKPLADNIGMNEIQFCIMMITALGVGFITPPLGLNLFVVSGITGESILKIAARAVPFVLGMLVVVLFIAYVPAISTTLLPEIYK